MMTYDEMVQEGRRLLDAETSVMWQLGDLALAVRKPDRSRPGDAPLQDFARDIGATYETIGTYRGVARSWPKKHRVAGASFAAHRALGSHPDRFKLLKPGMTERSARRLAGHTKAKALGSITTVTDAIVRLRAARSWIRSGSKAVSARAKLTAEERRQLHEECDGVKDAIAELDALLIPARKVA